MRLILASQSPRRKELMAQIGMDFQSIVSYKEEVINSHIPRDVVCELSRQKAEDVYDLLKEKQELDDTVIIGADTVVAYEENILGKPVDRQDAVRMLKLLSGGQHSVWTGVTIIKECKEGPVIKIFQEETKVYMYEITPEEIDEYVAGGEPDDKAGAYAIQGMGGKFIKKIQGDYSNVVGLPIGKLYHILKELQD